MEPCFIVDNEYSKYNNKIIDKHMLKDVYQTDMYIIVTIENAAANMAIMKELAEYIPTENIINLFFRNKGKFASDRRYEGEGFLFSDFMPCIKDSKKSDGWDRKSKIKIRIAHSSPVIWNSIRTICQAFREDEHFDVLLVIGHPIKSHMEQQIRQAKENGYKYKMYNEYRAEEDNPDIVILTSPFDHLAMGGTEFRKYAKLVVVASFLLIGYLLESAEQLREYQERQFGKYHPDYYLYDSLLYKEISGAGHSSEKIVEMGNAKFDGIWQATKQEKLYDGRWKKLKGKTTVLWTTTHGVSNKEIAPCITFDLYAATILGYAHNDPEIGIIFRPHKNFIDEMLETGFWSRQDLKKLKEYCEASPNIVFDDTDTYDISMSVADGILTDFCGIICSALPTLKPICIARRPGVDLSCHKDLMKSYYFADEKKDIVTFFKQMKDKQDPMLEIRKKASVKYVKNFDGKNGMRIKEFCYKKFIEKETRAEVGK